MNAINFALIQDWGTGFEGELVLTNESDALLENWTLEFTADFEITSMWNAEIVSREGDRYTIRFADYNPDLSPGETLSIGFVAIPASSGLNVPSEYQLNGNALQPDGMPIPSGSDGQDSGTPPNDDAQEPVDPPVGLPVDPDSEIDDVSISFQVDSQWQGGFGGSITITNRGDTAIEGWLLNFDSQFSITSLWNAERVMATDNNYTIADAGWNRRIATNSSISFGFNGDWTGDTVPEPTGYQFNGELLESLPSLSVSDVSNNPNNSQGNDDGGLVTIANDDTGSDNTSPDNTSPDDTGNTDTSNTAGELDYVVGAYYPEWAIYDRDFQVEDIPADNLTHIFYAFAQVDSNGEVAQFDPWAATQTTFGGKYSWDQSQAGEAGNFAELRALKAENPHLTNMLSIGGWTLSASFSDIALTDASREKFALSAVDFMVDHGFDGLDIDWEYPVCGGLASNIYRPEDTQNYTLLLGELREQLDLQEALDGNDYQLTIASPAGFDKIANYDLAGMSQYLDFINVMTYDYHGAWENTTNHQAALYASSSDPFEYADQYNVASTVQQYLDAGVAAEDIVLGAPLYGRSWTGVDDVNDGLFQSATGAGPGTYENGVFDYDDLFQKVNDPNSGYVRYWDDEAKVPFVYNESLGVFSTYEDVESLGMKLDFVKDRELGGMFFWEFSADLPGSHSDSLIGLTASELAIV